MQILLSIFIWVIFGLSTAYFAQKKGRDPAVWFVIGLLLGLVGLLLVIFLPPVEEEETASNENEIRISPLAINEDYSDSEFLPKGYENFQWFYLSDLREQVGPLTFVELKDKWRDGIIRGNSLVWCEGMTEWHSLEEMGLFQSK